MLKTGGGGSSGKDELNIDGLDAEKLKGIEPKMVELIMNEVFNGGYIQRWDSLIPSHQKLRNLVILLYVPKNPPGEK